MANGEITFYEYNNVSTSAYAPSIVHLGGNVYAYCKLWTGSGPVYVYTFSIDEDGSITQIDGWNTGINAFGSCIIRVSSTVCAIAYSDYPYTKGYIMTFGCSEVGAITKSAIQTYNFATGYPDLVWIRAKPRNVSGQIWAILCQQSTPGTKMWTISIPVNGSGMSTVDTQTWSLTQNKQMSLAQLNGEIWGWVSEQLVNSAVIYTCEITAAGAITAKSSLVLAGVLTGTPCVFKVAEGVAGIRLSNSTLSTRTINADGSIGSQIDQVAEATCRWTYGADYNVFVYQREAYLYTRSIADGGVIGDVIDSKDIGLVTIGTYDIVKGADGKWAGVTTYETAKDAEISFSVAGYPPDALLLEQAFDQAISATDPTWTDITTYLMELTTKRGRQHELDKIEAGTAIFILNNAAGDWWRLNTGGAFYPDIRPLTLTRLRYLYSGTYYNLWYGVSEGYEPGWLESKGGFTPIMLLTCVDVFKGFARYRIVDANPALTEHANPGDSHAHVDSVYGLVEGQSIKLYDDGGSEILHINQVAAALSTVFFTTNVVGKYRKNKGGALKKFPSVLSGQRVKDIILEAQWPLALTSIDGGQVLMKELSPGTGGTNCLSELQVTAEAEDGVLFVAGNGIVTFHDSIARTKSPYITVQATFKDDDTDSKYIEPELSDDDTFLYNEAVISGDLIGEQSMLDPTAQANQGPRAIVRKDSRIYNAHDAAAQAFMLVERFKVTQFRCMALHIYPKASEADLWPKILGYDIATRINLLLNNSINPAELDADLHVEGVEHSWRASDDLWATKWQLWDINRYRAYNALHDGYLYNRSLVSYNDCQTAAQCSYSPFNDAEQIYIGQRTTAIPAWDIMRGLVEIDTSLLLTGDAILEAYLLVYVSELYADSSWSLTLVGDGGVTNPLADTDYGILGAEMTDNGNVSISAPPGWRVIALNATGIAAIVKEGTTRFGLRSSRDISASAPSAGENEFAILTGYGTQTAPKLVVRLL